MVFSIRRSRLASVGLAGVLAVGVVSVGSVAMAQQGPSAGQEAGARHGRAHKYLGNILKNAGLTREEIQEGAAAGLTWGQIIDQYGDVPADQAKANALAALSERLDVAVAEGKISQERADEIEANAPAHIDRFLAATPGELRGEHKPRAAIFKIAKHSLETVAELLGTDVSTLREQLAGGQTVADIAGDQTQSVIDALVADSNAAIDQAVANGRLDPENADEAKARAAAAIGKWVTEGRPERPAGAPTRRAPNAQ